MSVFGTIIGLLLIAILIVLIVDAFRDNWYYVKYCEMQEKCEEEKKEKTYWQRMAENPPKILNVKMIGEFYEKDFTTKG